LTKLLAIVAYVTFSGSNGRFLSSPVLYPVPSLMNQMLQVRAYLLTISVPIVMMLYNGPVWCSCSGHWCTNQRMIPLRDCAMFLLA